MLEHGTISFNPLKIGSVFLSGDIPATMISREIEFQSPKNRVCISEQIKKWRKHNVPISFNPLKIGSVFLS